MQYFKTLLRSIIGFSQSPMLVKVTQVLTFPSHAENERERQIESDFSVCIHANYVNVATHYSSKLLYQHSAASPATHYEFVCVCVAM